MTDRDEPLVLDDEPAGEEPRDETASETAEAIDLPLNGAAADESVEADEPESDLDLIQAEIEEFAEELESEAAAEAEPAGDEDHWRHSTAAFVLGVLDPADAAAAARAFAASPALQDEVLAIIPVADILTSLYQPQTGATQIARAAVAETTETVERVAARTPRAQRSARREVRPVAVPTTGRITPAAIAMGVLGVVAAFGLLWALALRDQISTRDQEIRALRAQVTELQQSANATVVELDPVSDAAAGARATVFFAAGDGTVLINATGLPAIEDDRVYQVWLQAAGSDTWKPGPTFRVNSAGEAVRRLAGESPGFARMAISEEPSPGSTEPTGDFLLQGELIPAGGQ